MPTIVIRNLVLMVISIVFIIAILMRVPEIGDKIMEFLFGKFGGSKTSDEGKVLFARIDDPLLEYQVNNFHLTNERHFRVAGDTVLTDCETYYSIDDYHFNRDYCLLFLTDEDTGIEACDDGYIYYLHQGTIVQGDIESLSDGIYGDHIGSEGCELHKHTDFIEGEFVIYAEHGALDETCMNEEIAKHYLEMKIFNTDNIRWSCGGNCHLLTRDEYGRIIIKYGVICANGGKWEACTEEKHDQEYHITVGIDNKFACCPGTGDFYVWKSGEQC